MINYCFPSFRKSSCGLIYVMLIMFILGNVTGSSAQSSIEVSGEITENTTWTQDTVRVTGDLLVRDSVTLSVDPGTLVEFQGHYTLQVWGTLLAEGTDNEKILFTINDTTGFSEIDTTRGGWNRIWFNNWNTGAAGAMSDNDTSRLSHCIIEYSKNFDSTSIENSNSGGGIMVRAFSRLVISDCRITRNFSHYFGGGISCAYGADIQIINNQIDSNIAHVWGGGIAAVYSKPVIRGNKIQYNKALSTTEGKDIWNNGGGGILCYNSHAIIENNTINFNKAGGGAGLGSINSRNIIRNNIFSYNVGQDLHPNWWWVGGGGIYTESSIDLIENNVFSNNIANSGGALRINGNNPQVINNLIINNSCRHHGGGIILQNCRPLLLNNTISNNYSGNLAGGMTIWDSKPVFVNNILWGNRQNTVGTGSQIHTMGGISNPDIYYSVIEGGMGQIGGTYQGEFHEVLLDDPDFINPSAGVGMGFDGLAADWSLDTRSLCVNMGTPEIENLTLPETDVYGNERIKHGRIDIGASEVHIRTDFFEGSISTDTIFIADTLKVTGDLFIEDNVTLTIAPGTMVEFQGHFGLRVFGTLYAAGTGDFPIKFTSYDTSGFSIDSVTDGSWGGIRILNINGRMSDNDTSILEYCTIEFVKSVRDTPAEHQGALRISDFSRIRLQYCTIRYNHSYYFGGGIYSLRSEPVILNCTISNNQAKIGGGFFCSHSEIILRNCLVTYNSSSMGDGGGICCISSKVTIENNLIYRNIAHQGRGAGLLLHGAYGIIRNNTIINNTTPVWGGGIACQSGITASGSIDIIGNIICNNYANDGGGLWISESDNARLINNTICFNEASDVGGGIFLDQSGPIHINNIIWGNTDNQKRQVVIGDNISLPSFYNCNIQDGFRGISNWASAPRQFPFENIINSNPHFVSPPAGPGSDFEALKADFSLLPISESIDAGMEDISELLLPLTDVYSNPRIHNQRVDIGAVENQDMLASIVDQPGNRISCEGDTVILNIVASDTVFYQWQNNGKDIPGAVYASLRFDSITVTDEGNYQCIVSNAYGNVNSNQVYLLVNKSPEILSGPSSRWLGTDIPFTFKVIAGGSQPLSYLWKKNGSVLTGITAPEFTLNEPRYSDEGIYACIIANSCGVDSTSPATIYLAPQICMVTVSTTTGKNLVVWEKNSTAPIFHYNVYRESGYANIYDLLATVPYDDLSILVDTAADPTVQAYLYKITATDTAGIETDMNLSRVHKTIHLLATKNPETNSTQLDWDRYVGFDYGSYEVYRSDTSFSFNSIHSMSSSTSTWADASPGTDQKYYRIAAVKPEPCEPSGNGKAGTGAYQHALSNMDDNKLKTTKIKQLLASESLVIYPNPFTDKAVIQFENPSNEPYRMLLLDMTGKVLKRMNNITSAQAEITREGIPGGLYLIELRGSRIYRSRILIE